jgi:hypothetical protein
VQGPAGVRTVELIGYVRPSTTYRVLRTVTLSQVGLAFVTLAPAGNARLAARQVGCAAGSSTVLSVRSVLSLSAVPVGLHVVRLSGSVLPHRYGRVVRLEVGPAAGTTSIVRTVRTDATGRYTVLVRVPAGRYKIVAKTFSDLTVMAGSSPTIFVSVR